MDCDLVYCIYNKSWRCSLEKISIDAAGLCGECIFVSISEKNLETLKESHRKELKSRDWPE